MIDTLTPGRHYTNEIPGRGVVLCSIERRYTDCHLDKIIAANESGV